MPRQERKPERDDIMLWVANEESFYTRVMRLYDRWVDEGDAWTEKFARREALNVVTEVAQSLQSQNRDAGKYTISEINAAVEEVLEDFEQYRDEEIADRQKKAAAKPWPRKPMDQGYLEYTRRMDGLLLKVGVSLLSDILDHPVNMTADDARKAAVEFFLRFMPVSSDKVRRALDTGDEHLNTIKLRLWDDQADKIGRTFMVRHRFSHSDVTGLLKHVAKWYYA